MENTRAEVAAIIDCIERLDQRRIALDSGQNITKTRKWVYLPFIAALFLLFVHFYGGVEGALLGFYVSILLAYAGIVASHFRQWIREAKEITGFIHDPFKVYLASKQTHLEYDQDCFDALAHFGVDALTIVHRRFVADRENISNQLGLISGIDKLGFFPGIITICVGASQLLLGAENTLLQLFFVVLSVAIFAGYIMAFIAFEAVQRASRYEGLLRFVIDNK